MSEEASFLKAMQESPNDVALRLVCADWLEERGDPRGELLRLPHLLTQPAEPSNRPQLEARMQALVDEGVPSIGPFRTNSLGMRFAWIPPGTFLMGSPPNEPGRAPHEIQHRVTLTRGFFLGSHPVTQLQWQTVMGQNPSRHKGAQLPVEHITWQDAYVFCTQLFNRDGVRYRMPTEAEWEHACRAGTTTPYCCSADKLSEYAWYGIECETRTVGIKKPNAWGLHDMHGNVWEWCHEWFSLYPQGEVTDPSGPAQGWSVILRGGSWTGDPQVVLRCANRNWRDPARVDDDVGLRVCFSVD